MRKFKTEETGIDGLKVVYPHFFGDDRGYFLKSFEKRELEDAGIFINITEINESKSYKNVLRGLHIQKKFPQAKLIRVEEGEIYDVAVDLRKNSPTYGKWRGVYLSKENRKMIFLPKGFAHGFFTVSEEAIATYVCDGEYIPEDESGIRWDDEHLKIEWPFDNNEILVLSEKDKQWGSFIDYDKDQVGLKYCRRSLHGTR